MAGIQEVAKAAGVSASTVSNVLTGKDGRMRADTRQRVLDAIKALNYTPNAIAQQLKAGHARTIGLIVPSVANPFWGAVAHYVERSAATLNYKVLIGNAERDPEAETRYAEALLGSGVRAVILGSAPKSFEHFRPLVGKGMLVGAFDRMSEGADELVASSVSVDQELGGRLATQHLVGLGHRRIAFISGPIKTTSRLGRLAGMRAVLERAELFDPSLIWQGRGISAFGDNEGLELGRNGARELLSLNDPPTAIVATNDMYALGAYAGARDLGYSVPADISVVGFDDIIFSEVMQPALTTIRQPIGLMTQTIVSSLVGQIEQGSAPSDDDHVAITPQLVVRASTADPRESRRVQIEGLRR